MADSEFGILYLTMAAWAVFLTLIFSFSTVLYTIRHVCEMWAVNRGKYSKPVFAAIRYVFSHLTKAVKKLVSERPRARQPDYSLWENTPDHRIAIRHRCLKSRGRRIFVSDRSDGMSVATLVIGSTNQQRIPLMELKTSPESDRQYVDNSDQLRLPPEASTITSIPRPELVRFSRKNEMMSSNQWIWLAGAFDHLTDKPRLMLNWKDQRKAA